MPNKKVKEATKTAKKVSGILATLTACLRATKDTVDEVTEVVDSPEALKIEKNM